MKTISPTELKGTLKVQPSKSVAHRAVICASQAKGTSLIRNIALSEDIKATLNALQAMGFCSYHVQGDCCTIQGGLKQGKKDALVDCGESGSTLRFLIPLAFDGVKRKFIGQGRLMSRPMQPYEELFSKRGYHKKKTAIEICGKLRGGSYSLKGDVSSQFISGLLFALPMTEDSSEIMITTTVESKPYINLTQEVQSEFNILSDWREDTIYIPANQTYVPSQLEVEGDYSHAAFYVVAAAINGCITLEGLKQNSTQGDSEILGIVKCMGADVMWEDGAVTIKSNYLKPVDIDVSQVPDLFPILAVLACATKGRMKLYNAARLRFKESDRLSAMATELETLGADITEFEDSVTICGTGTLKGGCVRAHGDHRIAMALSIASLIAEEDIVIDTPDVVSKSAPAFFEEFISLGGKVK